MSAVKRNPVYPELRYNYSGDKKATYLGMFWKIGLLLIVLFISIYFGYTFASEPTYVNILIYIGVTPITAYIALRLALKVEPLTALLSFVFSTTFGITLGFIIRLIYRVGEDSILLIAIFTTIIVLVVYLIIFLIKPLRVQNSMYQGMIGMFLGIAFSIVGSLGLDYLNITYSYDQLFLMVPIFSFLAAIFYTVDFNKINTLVEADAPKLKEWNLALGLLLTIVWVYIRIVELILYIIYKNNQRRKRS
ncbi:Bax inhibitor 1 like protein [Candidatus Izimaplasma bacterium HR1]|jgi:uncharacterized YccA/Bax inhibitor family protein|uniref:Bax inhibitor-1/YccA family membrane protein n=1 Tax=Candidatus Izimoplasma sp. HR1 TaxID=1541959 RepID=UPI0004F8FE5B|nr:Bax inhibitor 1 like protein [Candidatus Izimaplasma bacterium HR1]